MRYEHDHGQLLKCLITAFFFVLSRRSLGQTMAKAKRPRVNLAKLKFQLSCEWGDCDHSASSMPFFMRHVKEHFVDFLPEGVTADNYKKHTLEPNGKCS